MEFFYIFTISYTLAGSPLDIHIPLQNSEQCQIAIRTSQRLAEELNADLFCKNTGVLSKSIRPKLRPTN